MSAATTAAAGWWAALARYMRAQKMTRLQLAAHLGVARNTIYYWEHEGRHPCRPVRLHVQTVTKGAVKA